jgi:two-component system LytT family response regulator
MKVLLVDDEASARRRLARMLSGYSDVEIVGEAEDGLEALHLAETLQPHVMFLDIQMPELDGFGVVRAMSSSAAMPLILFATSFDQHALQAFDANAIAYLLKPIEPARLEVAMGRARRLLASETDLHQEDSVCRLLPLRGGCSGLCAARVTRFCSSTRKRFCGFPSMAAS